MDSESAMSKPDLDRCDTKVWSQQDDTQVSLSSRDRKQSIISNDEVITTDMPPEVGGEGSATSPGWYVRVALATCDATVIAMKAAREGIELNTLEVTVNYDSDARGTLGIDSSIHPGPMDMTVTVRLGAGGVPEEKLRKIVKWAEAHSPVADTICRAISYTTEVEIV